MAAAPHPQRDAAIATIRNLTAFHGAEEGEKLARAKYSEISKGTFSGWVKLARRPSEPASVRPTSVRAYAAPVADGKPLTFEERVARIDDHVAMIVEASTRETVDPDTGEGRRVARNPAMLAQAVRLQHAAAELLLTGSQLAWNLGRMQDLYDTIIEEIGKVSPEVQRAVFDRLREVNEQRGNSPFGADAAPAAVAAPALPDVGF